MSRKPLIGITAGLNDQEKYQVLSRYFMEAITTHGALPVMLPLTTDEELLASYAEQLDGFLFSGGGDVDPLFFGQLQQPACGSVDPLRDLHELTLARILLERKDKPVLGICRGLQVLNIALGGDIYQDLPSGYEGKLISHRQKQSAYYASHPVQVTEGSLLHLITRKERLMVNSLHHQAIHHAKGWNVCATAPDGVIEAAELPGHPFFIGVQWHPERLYETDPASSDLFRTFVDACRTM
ncbi:MAG: gamma-glutamyl-gamma-aminobutyrate hydrolase family protein [Clostridiales bacterium]|nr:gamma-glutamyl-gamma-aminobutyrate hydrolase family protein [Clostridiales bacterium]